MKSIEQALRWDEIDNPVKAADAYEEALKAQPDSKLILANLMAIYYSSLEGGYSAHHQLPQSFTDLADQRINELAKQFASHDVEADYWKRIYQVQILGEDWDKMFPPDYEEVKKGNALAPYLALFISSGGSKYQMELERLLDEVREGKTQRERELKSVAEAAKRHFALKAGKAPF